MLTVYDLDFEPAPHVAEHEPHPPQSPSQSTGHAPSLQLVCWEVPCDTEHEEPPFAAAVLTVYDLDFEPAPHVAEHEPHPPQSPTQLTALNGASERYDAMLLRMALTAKPDDPNLSRSTMDLSRITYWGLAVNMP